MAEKLVSLADILTRMEAAWQRMSVSNPHRSVLTDAAQILIQQSHELTARREAGAKADAPRIILPSAGLYDPAERPVIHTSAEAERA